LVIVTIIIFISFVVFFIIDFIVFGVYRARTSMASGSRLLSSVYSSGEL